MFPLLLLCRALFTRERTFLQSRHNQKGTWAQAQEYLKPRTTAALTADGERRWLAPPQQHKVCRESSANDFESAHGKALSVDHHNPNQVEVWTLTELKRLHKGFLTSGHECNIIECHTELVLICDTRQRATVVVVQNMKLRRHHGGSLVGPIVARIAKVAFK
jgi:hypothetical protein